MILLVADIFIEIVNHLKLSNILNLKLLSKFHKELICNYHWLNKKVTVLNIDILNNHSFKNVLYYKNDINDHILKLRNCHTLDLSFTNITDE